MKIQYREIKTWECSNPDGSKVVIAEGDDVKIHYDVPDDAFSDDFKSRHTDNTVAIHVYQLFKNKISGSEIGGLPGCFVALKANQIVSVEKPKE